MLKLRTAVVALALFVQPTYALAETQFEGDWRRCQNNQDNPLHWDVAIASCTSVIKSGKETSRAGLAHAYNNRAWGYFKLGKPLQGLPDVEKSLALNANFARALDTRGHIFEALGRRDEAIADFRRALSIGQTDQALQSSSGAGLARLGVTQDALSQKSSTETAAAAAVPSGGMRPSNITHSSENDEFGRSVMRALRLTMPQMSRMGRLKIRLLLDEKGRLRDLRLVESAGDSEMEQKVLKAAKGTSFPTPPAGSSIPDRTFLVTYVYH